MTISIHTECNIYTTNYGSSLFAEYIMELHTVNEEIVAKDFMLLTFVRT